MQKVEKSGAALFSEEDSVQICVNCYLTGELGSSIKEQSLIIDTKNGTVVITGCSHPGIVNIVKRAKELLDKDVYMVFGGFHLMNHSNEMIAGIICFVGAMIALGIALHLIMVDQSFEARLRAFGFGIMSLITGILILVVWLTGADKFIDEAEDLIEFILDIAEKISEILKKALGVFMDPITFALIKGIIDMSLKSVELTSMVRLMDAEISLTELVNQIGSVLEIKTREKQALLEIDSMNTLLGHPVLGSSWEGFAIENVLTVFSRMSSSFYRTAKGAEIDLVLTRGLKKIAVEFKASYAPKVTRGFWNAIEDIKPDTVWIVIPEGDMYPLKENVFVISLSEFLRKNL